MNKKLKKTSITDDINSKAKEIINQDNRTSLEAKKFEFCNFLDEYYNKLSGDSELLITRKEEINFYSTTSKDFYSSILISILTSAMISFLFWILDKTEEIYKSMPNSSFILNIILSAIFSGGILVFLYYVIKVLNNIHNERKKLSDYEKLNVKEYEIQKIDEILEKKYKKYQIDIKNKSCDKNGGKNETSI